MMTSLQPAPLGDNPLSYREAHWTYRPDLCERLIPEREFMAPLVET
jgi:hypothetical protein